MIVVTGASGVTGVALLQALRRRNVPARAVVSRESSMAAVREAGATEVVVGNLRDAADMRRALEGASRVYHICPRVSDDELGIGRNVLAAAKANGLRQFVFHSLVHAQSETMLHHRDKRHVELELIESGLPYTILKPTMYMQNLLWEWEAVTARGVYRLPYSEQSRMSLVDLDDVAEAGATVLTQDGWEGGEFELCSGDNLTRVEMAAVLTEVLGRTVKAETSTIEEWKPIGSRTRTPFQVDRVIRMFGHYDQIGLPGGNGRVLRMILGRAPTTYREAVRKMAAERGWKAPR
ncbi:MAG TPA: NmrA family NAD(P)-binding protein [Ramlibacter sp.]|nr:NmrA family NAD(P)-binding protein [Ramlibacter sp.]